VAGINLQVGPQFGFLTSAESEFNPIDNEPQNLADVKSAYKKSDVSAALGVGWDLPFGLTVDARYNLGLSKINDGQNSDESKNQVFQVSLGYKLIKLGK
ncbi:MAG TPA: outer membrane beta-barrel protein, partial [Cyclobacteriaceae bacterium]|nr:outer membrane beta-barrel protein [Cyclobacteriaceae bacterium]